MVRSGRPFAASRDLRAGRSGQPPGRRAHRRQVACRSTAGR